MFRVLLPSRFNLRIPVVANILAERLEPWPFKPAQKKRSFSGSWQAVSRLTLARFQSVSIPGNWYLVYDTILKMLQDAHLPGYRKGMFPNWVIVGCKRLSRHHVANNASCKLLAEARHATNSNHTGCTHFHDREDL